MSWGEEATTPPVEWTMSASLRDVVRVGNDVAEVTNLRAAVEAWRLLDPEHREAAVLKPERPITIDGAQFEHFEGERIKMLVDRLPDEA